MAPLLQREIDRENVFSPAVRFFQKTSFFARPHADVVVRDAELFKTESVLERFPINYDSDDGLERRAEGARNMSEFVKQFDEEDDEMGQERRAGGKGDADKCAFKKRLFIG